MSFDNTPHKNLVAETISAILVSKNYTQASELLEIDRSTLYKRIKSHPEIKEIAQHVFDYSQEALKLASAKAVNVLVKGLDCSILEYRFQSAREILDRVGLTKDNGKNIIFSKTAINEPTKIVLTRYEPSQDQ